MLPWQEPDGEPPRESWLMFRSAVLPFALALVISGCSPSGPSTDLAPLAIENFEIQVDEEFEGLLEDFYGTPFEAHWEIDSSNHGPGAAGKTEVYKLGVTIEADYQTGEYEFNFDAMKCFAIPLTDGESVRSRSIPQGLWEKRGSDRIGQANMTKVFWQMAALPVGGKAIFTLEYFGLDELENCVSYSAIQPSLSSASFAWVRPPHTGPPNPPVVVPLTALEDSTRPCWSLMEEGSHSFRNFPTLVAGVGKPEGQATAFSHWAEGGWKPLALKRFNVWSLGIDCDDVGGTRFSYTIAFENSMGSSEQVSIDVVSPKPGKTVAERDAELLAPLIEGCEQPLNISEGAAIGSCGYLSVKVFQADLATGDCAFLGDWKDSSGNNRTGYFSFCERFRPEAFREGATYSVYVKKTGIVTYENRLGGNNQAVSFVVVAAKP